jgi:hypothetical protein
LAVLAEVMEIAVMAGMAVLETEQAAAAVERALMEI